MFEGAKQLLSKVHITERLLLEGEVRHKHHNQELLTSATKTLDEEDNGKLFLCTVTTVITLPSTGAQYGPYYIMNYGADGTVQISISPAAADKIYGPDITAADDTDIINTLATAKKGDFIKIFYAGATGWSIGELRGTWAQAS